ncbi:hypothetical protein Bca52824_070729 [Brassica carinata]|uniref:Peptide-methionine (S)-S-oxide reductase n=1 Tax=Brassica carinata TaxID=52824 RepID=A0A8X7Q7G3_BRACI|nr:hypothetical protein Bca52824_070729 [Brassica carinata]
MGLHGRTDALKQRVQQGESMDSLLPIISSILRSVCCCERSLQEGSWTPTFQSAIHVPVDKPTRNLSDATEGSDTDAPPETIIQFAGCFRSVELVYQRVPGVTHTEVDRKIVTEILPAKKFYRAEEDNQQYLSKGGRFGLKQSSAKGCNDPIRCYG